MWMGGALSEFQCAFKGETLKSKMVEERTPIECDKFKLAPRTMRARLQDYREVGITTVYGNGSVQLPAQIRQNLEIKDGDKILWIRKGTREFSFRKVGVRPPFKPHYA